LAPWRDWLAFVFSDVVRSEVLCLAEVELDALEVVLEVAFFVIAIAS
jgi:hypothetical protein